MAEETTIGKGLRRAAIREAIQHCGEMGRYGAVCWLPMQRKIGPDYKLTWYAPDGYPIEPPYEWRSEKNETIVDECDAANLWPLPPYPYLAQPTKSDKPVMSAERVLAMHNDTEPRLGMSPCHVVVRAPAPPATSPEDVERVWGRTLQEIRAEPVPFAPDFDKLEESLAAMTDHAPMPVQGYTTQSDARLALVNRNKDIEERVLRILDDLAKVDDVDKRWLAIGRTHIEQAFMCVNRSIFQPQRAKLPEDPK